MGPSGYKIFGVKKCKIKGLLKSFGVFNDVILRPLDERRVVYINLLSLLNLSSILSLLFGCFKCLTLEVFEEFDLF